MSASDAVSNDQGPAGGLSSNNAAGIVRAVINAYGNRFTDHCGCADCQTADETGERNAAFALAALLTKEQP